MGRGKVRLLAITPSEGLGLSPLAPAVREADGLTGAGTDWETPVIRSF
ncbi:MAG: hypothetical protein K0S54_2087 [Alphaproteobacteria bacterium]|nr:hypothetical protein [Alphaproteobacteria bacterium]